MIRTPLRKLLFASVVSGVPAVEDTVSGNPVTFLTDLAKPLKSLVANFLPVQSPGTPSPENVLPITGWTGVDVFHAGKNMLKLAETDMASAGWNRYFPNTLTKAGTYTISCKAQFGGDGEKGCKIALAKYNYNTSGNIIKDFTDYSFGKSSSGNYYSFTVTDADLEQGKYICFSGNSGNMSFASIESGQIMIEAGNVTPSAYEPYNGTIYPVTFPALGKNLFDETNLTQYARYIRYTSPTQAKWTPSDDSISYSLPVEPNTTYTVSVNNAEVSVFRVCAIESNVGGAESSNAYQWSSGDKVCTITTSATEKYLVIQINKAISQERAGQIQVEIGNNATAYEPYTNTVYGGHVDLVTGEVWRTYGLYNLSGRTWTLSHPQEASRNVFRFNLTTVKISSKAYCNMYKKGSYQYFSELPNLGCGFLQSNGVAFAIRDDSYTNETDFATHMENGVLIAELAEPVLIATLTPQQINTIKGNNTVWSDANSDCSVTFLKKR